MMQYPGLKGRAGTRKYLTLYRDQGINGGDGRRVWGVQPLFLAIGSFMQLTAAEAIQTNAVGPIRAHFTHVHVFTAQGLSHNIDLMWLQNNRGSETPTSFCLTASCVVELRTRGD